MDDGRTTDDGLTDGRTPDHGHPISSPCEPSAQVGSGELYIYMRGHIYIYIYIGMLKIDPRKGV